MNTALDRNLEKAVDSGILADNALSTSETQTPDRGLHHLSTTYHIAASIPTVEPVPVLMPRHIVRPRSRGHVR